MTEFNSLLKIKRLHAKREEQRSQIPIELVDIDQMMNDISFLILSIDRFDKKMTEKKCNAGHENTLPLYLWDCPTCTALLRTRINSLKDQVVRLMQVLKPLNYFSEKIHRMTLGSTTDPSQTRPEILENAKTIYDEIVKEGDI